MKNKVNLIGRLGADPELKHFDSDAVKATVSLATSEKFKNKQQEQVEETEWHNLVFWGKGAEIAAQYLKKGGLVDIEGKIKTRSWEHENEKHYRTEILVDRFLMLGGKPAQSSNEPQNQSESQYAGTQEGPTDDLPF